MTTSFDRKPRSDSPLRMLPWERQQQIIASLQSRSQTEVLADILKTDNLDVYPSTLTRFCKWHKTRSQALGEQLHNRAIELRDFNEALQEPAPQLDIGSSLKLGNRIVLMGALKTLDADELARVQRLHQKDRTLDLHERRVALFERREQLELLKFGAEVDREADCFDTVSTELPKWCEAQRKAGEPVAVTEEMIEDNLRKSFDLRPRSQPVVAKPQPPAAGRATAPPGAAQPAPSDGARLCSASLPAEPAAAATKTVNPTGSAQVNPTPTASAPDTQHAIRNSSTLHWTPPDPNAFANMPPGFYDAPTVQPQPEPDVTKLVFHPDPAPHKPEEQMCIGELLNVRLPFNKCLISTGEGLELASTCKAFYPRLLCTHESLTPQFVRQAMRDIREGRL